MTDTMTGWVNPDLAKTPAELLVERSTRIKTAYAMGQPDRVPMSLGLGYFSAELAGVSHADLYRDWDLQTRVLVEAAARFGPDETLGPWHDPRPSTILGDRMTKWPGWSLPDSSSYQFDEHEFMKAEDYDAFLNDMSDFAIRTYLPRAFSELEGLQYLPPLGMSLFGYYNIILGLPALGAPPVQKAFEALQKAAAAQAEWIGMSVGQAQALAAVGVPPVTWLGALTEAPFDFMSDTLRGMRGIFLDLRQRPDQLLAAEKKVLDFQVDNAIATCRMMGNPYTFIPLHRGSDGFMSIEQFEKFYWPQLEEMQLRLIDAGITPVVYYEGIWDKRVEYLARLPKGKTVGMFQNSNMQLIKETAGEVMCIVGGMPNSTVRGGSVAEIREKTQELCETLGKGGGYVMATYVNELEGCSVENVQAWADATKEFGVYR